MTDNMEHKKNRSMLIIDGYGIAYRAYFAFTRRPLINSRGENCSALHGFYSTLITLVKKYNPGYLLVAMDSIGATFRHKLYPEYKANRDKTPEDLHTQIDILQQVLQKMAVVSLKLDGYEADDVIASCREYNRRLGIETLIVSADKDLLQLVDDDCRMIRPKKDGYKLIEKRSVSEELGVNAEQVGDYLALMGDSSDNIPGVKGVGAKTAAALLGQYNDIATIYHNLSSIKPPSVANKLAAGERELALSRRLVQLRDDLQLSFELPQLQTCGIDWQAAGNELKKYELNNIAGRYLANVVSAGIPTAAAADGSPAVTVAGELFADLSIPAKANSSTSVDKHNESINNRRGDYQILTDMIEVTKLFKKARQNGCFAFDSETDGLDVMTARPVGFSLAIEPEQAYYLPVTAAGKDYLPEEPLKKELAALLADSSLLLVGQNFKFDYKILKRWGIETKCRIFDTMIAAWMLESQNLSYSMDTLARQLLDYDTIKFSQVVAKGATFASVELDKAGEYAAEDADITFRLYRLLTDKLTESGLDKLFYDVEMVIVPLLAEMELRGIALNSAALADYSDQLQVQLKKVEKEIYHLCGHEFNLNSPKQLAEVLFVERKLTPIKKNKTGYSTDVYVLQNLADLDPVPAKVLRNRSLSKLKSTYVDALPKLVNSGSGRLHTTFAQNGTSTGRFSSQNPNLQNIPVRDDEGRKIRTAFVAKERHMFISADYSQIELMVMAHLADDQALIDAFSNDQDVHRVTASLIFGRRLEEVSPEQRRIAKTINFGIIYGMGAFRLARDLSISRTEADTFIKTYFTRYRRVKEFIAETVAAAEQNGFVTTLLGHRRFIRNINSRNKNEKMAAERVAVNTPIQGGAADIVKLAMINCDKAINDTALESCLLLQVHDELIFEAPLHEKEACSRLIRREMESAYKLRAPLKVNIEYGATWGEIH